MGEVPSIMWIVSGILITGFSAFLGFIKPVEYAVFFKIMIFIGVGMLLFGLIKQKLQGMKETSSRDNPRIEQQHQKHYAQTPGYPQAGYSQSQARNIQHVQRPTHQHTMHPAQQHAYQNPASAVSHQGQRSRFCHQCGTPLLSHHKFCPMCGARV